MTRLVTLTLVVALAAVASTATPATGKPKPRPSGSDAVLRQYAQDTWRSFEMMVDKKTGLPSDNVGEKGDRSEYTSPTNIGAYLWSTLAARDLGIIARGDAMRRMKRTIRTLEDLERHEPSGQYYNWYDPSTGEKLTTWPVDGSPVYPFLSSVDNGWLAASLRMVAEAEPKLAREAGALAESMDFGFYYDEKVGQLRGGAWTEEPPNYGCPDAIRDGVYFTCHHYGTLNTEPRIASYLGIADGDIPAEHYFKLFRTFPATCDWSWQETKPGGVTRNYMGVDVFEGHYVYNDKRIVPSWGGSMFEALMVPLLVPEEQWGTRSWAINHPLYVEAQIEHGLEEAGYGYWGFSPSNKPEGGYSEYGVDAIGLNPDGYASNNEPRTLVDRGFEGCREGTPDPPQSAYTNGVVTPHASFLALDFAKDEALENLANLREDFDIYGRGGFFDAVNVDTGVVSRRYLALDQGMIMLAIANELTNDRLQGYLAGYLEPSIRPLLAMEEFTAGRGN